ncbi:fungal-specific transcription factor domain-containing protein [Dipodascopsis uninucleata]
MLTSISSIVEGSSASTHSSRALRAQGIAQINRSSSLERAETSAERATKRPGPTVNNSSATLPDHRLNSRREESEPLSNSATPSSSFARSSLHSSSSTGISQNLSSSISSTSSKSSTTSSLNSSISASSADLVVSPSPGTSKRNLSAVYADVTSLSDSGAASYTRDDDNQLQLSQRKNRKVPQERQRVSRACDSCKKRKTRCSGKRPCVRCVQLSLSCEFNAEYHRGRPPSPEWSGLELPTHDRHTSRINYKSSSVSQARNEEISPSTGTEDYRSPPDIESRAQFDSDTSNINDRDNVMPSTNMSTYTSSRNRNSDDNLFVRTSISEPQNSSMRARDQYYPRESSESGLADSQIASTGNTSGISFLIRVQRKLHDISTRSSSSSILTFGDPEIPHYLSNFFILPPKPEAKAMLEFYFSYAMPTYRFLHRPSVEAWLEEFYESFDSTNLEEGAREKFAILVLLFAHAKQFPNFSKNEPFKDNSAMYFQAAQSQLELETGRPRVTSVQARLCQCFYLLACSRINHCRSLFCTVAHLVQALGLHRKQRHLPNTVNYIEQECLKRSFWSAYQLDKYLSAVLGRPSIFHDGDIDQDLASLVNDEDLTAEHMTVYESPKARNCIMLAPVLHASLVRLLSGILRDVYSIQKVSRSALYTYARQYTVALKNWKADLPAFLDPSRVQPSLLIPLLQRQSRMLALAYSHCLILANRPFLLGNFASLTVSQSSQEDPQFDKELEDSVLECISAAMITVDIVEDLSHSKQLYPSLWFTQYVTFCSVVVLYVYTIRCQSMVKLRKKSEYQKYFDAAQRCHSQLSVAATQNSLAERYEIILDELRREATRAISSRIDASTNMSLPTESFNSNLSSINLPNKNHNNGNRSQNISNNLQSPIISGQRSANSDDTELQSLGQQRPRYTLDTLSMNVASVMEDNSYLNDIDVSSLASYSAELIADLTSWEQFDNLVMDFIGSTPGLVN